MGFLAWRAAGINPRHSVIVNGEFLRKNKTAVDGFVKVTQKASPPAWPIPTLIGRPGRGNGALKADNELGNWALVEELMATGPRARRRWDSTTRAHEGDYQLVAGSSASTSRSTVRTANERVPGSFDQLRSNLAWCEPGGADQPASAGRVVDHVVIPSYRNSVTAGECLQDAGDVRLCERAGRTGRR